MYSKFSVLNTPYANYPFTHNPYMCTGVPTHASIREGGFWDLILTAFLKLANLLPTVFYIVAFDNIAGIDINGRTNVIYFE